MATETVKAEKRGPGGRSVNARLRRGGLVPAVVYGGAAEPEFLALSARELALALDHHRRVIAVEVEGTRHELLIKDVQRDHLGVELVHLDLMRIDASKLVRVRVPVELKGEPVGAKAGGVLMTQLNEIEVECSMAHVPELFSHNIESLGLGAALHVNDLSLPEGVVAVAPEDVVCVVTAKRGTKEAELATGAEGEEDGDTGAEPEVIGRGKGDDAGGDA